VSNCPRLYSTLKRQSCQPRAGCALGLGTLLALRIWHAECLNFIEHETSVGTLHALTKSQHAFTLARKLLKFHRGRDGSWHAPCFNEIATRIHVGTQFAADNR